MNDFSQGGTVDVGAASPADQNTLEITARDDNRTADDRGPLTSDRSSCTVQNTATRAFVLSVLRGEVAGARRKRSSPLAQAACLLFLSLNSDASGVVTTSTEQIADGVQLSRAAVEQAVLALMNAGAVKVVLRAPHGGKPTYQLTVPPPVEKA